MAKKILVIGAGASGMMAAIQAARNGAEVTVLEHMDRAGKKILSTGNGRCNLTNRYQEESCYRCGRKGFVSAVLKQFSVEDTLDFFGELGILPKDRNGYIYPNSDQASSVLDVLRMEMEHLGIRLMLNCHVQEISSMSDGGRNADSRITGYGPGQKSREGRFLVRTDLGEFEGDCLILAAGSKAAPVTGSDGSGYELARRFGHLVVPPLPALVQLRCKEKHYKRLAGIRTDAKITLMVFNQGKGWKILAGEQGELQLTDYGISGIPTFQVSRYASVALHNGRQVKAVIDFLPQIGEGQVEKLLKLRCRQMEYKTAEEWMTGLLNKKLGVVLLKLSGIPLQQTMDRMTSDQWKELVRNLKSYETVIESTNSFEQAQVCCGGVDTETVNADTLESNIVPGLYFAGEILDVDGICGGYNLQWAWSSGAAAGRHAAGAGKNVVETGKYAVETGKHLAKTDKHAAGADKHAAERGKHAAKTEKHASGRQERSHRDSKRKRIQTGKGRP